MQGETILFVQRQRLEELLLEANTSELSDCKYSALAGDEKLIDCEITIMDYMSLLQLDLLTQLLRILLICILY